MSGHEAVSARSVGIVLVCTVLIAGLSFVIWSGGSSIGAAHGGTSQGHDAGLPPPTLVAGVNPESPGPSRSQVPADAKVRIVDERGGPLAAARVLDADGSTIGLADADGECAVPPGCRLVKVVHTGFVPRVFHWPKGATGNTTIVLSPGLRLHGRVVDQDGTPLAGTAVFISRLGVRENASKDMLGSTLAATEDGKDVGYASTTMTDRRGEFAFESLAAGRHEVIPRRPGYVCVPSGDDGLEGTVVASATEPSSVEFMLYRLYAATYRILGNGQPLEYVRSCLGLGYGYPAGIERLRPTNVDAHAVREMLRGRGCQDDVRIVGLSHAKKDSRLAGPVTGRLTANVLGTRLGQFDLVFAPVDTWEPTHAMNLQVPTPPAEQFIVESEDDVILRAEDRRRSTFLEVSRTGKRRTFLVPKGTYQIRPMADQMLGPSFRGETVTVPALEPSTAVRFSDLASLAVSVVDLAGRESDRGGVHVQGPGGELFITTQRLHSVGKLPVEPGRYRVVLRTSDGKGVDNQDVDVDEKRVCQVVLRWRP